MNWPATVIASRLALFYALHFSVVGVLLPFWPVWLESRGLTPGQIGIALALGTSIKIIVNPLVAHIADRRGDRRSIIIALSVVSIGAYALFIPATGFGMILVVTALFFGFWPAKLPLGESLTLLAARAHQLDYGRIRLWGSITFILAAVVAGQILGDASPDTLLWIVLGLLVVSSAVCLALPTTTTPPPPSGRWPLLEVIRLPGFLLFLLVSALIQSSHAVYYGFATLHWIDAGLSEATIGWLWAEGVLAEIVLFMVGARLVRRFGPVGLMVLAAIAGVVRWPVLALSTDLSFLTGAQLLHAFTFGAAHLGAMYFITRRVPASLSASAQAIYASTVMGAALAGALLGAGSLYSAFQAQAYWAMAAMAACALVLTPFLKRHKP